MALNEFQTRGKSAITSAIVNRTRPRIAHYVARAAALTIVGAAMAVGAQTAPAAAVPNDQCAQSRAFYAQAKRMLDDAHRIGDQAVINGARSLVWDTQIDVLNNC